MFDRIKRIFHYALITDENLETCTAKLSVIINNKMFTIDILAMDPEKVIIEKLKEVVNEP